MKRLNRSIWLFLAVILLLTAAGGAAGAFWTGEYDIEMYGSRFLRDPEAASGRNYTDCDYMANMLDSIFHGHVGLYYDMEYTSEVDASLGTNSVPNWGEMLNCPGVQRGWSCYIYANAVYYTLFGECPGNGYHDSYEYSEKVGSVTGTAETLYGSFLAAGVAPCGAYARTGSHSFIILSYDENGIVLLDGNSVNGGNGLVQITEASWEYFYRYFLSKGENPIDHIIQPTAETLEALQNRKAFRPDASDSVDLTTQVEKQ